MKNLILLSALAMLMAISSPDAQDGDNNAGNNNAAADDKVEAVVKKVGGDIDDILIELPDESLPDDERYPVAEVDARYPEGTTIETGPDSTIIVGIEGTVDGKEIKNSMLSVRHTSNVKIARMLVSGEDDSVVTRLKVKTGEVRVKVTNDREDYQTDFKVSTPNATASITGTDVQAISFSMCFGTSIAVQSGNVSAARGNGTSVDVGAGNDVDDQSGSALEAALSKAQNIAPIGMVAFEVKVGQLITGGIERPSSDLNNPATNPNSGRSQPSDDIIQQSFFDDGSPLPSKVRGGNNR